MKDLSHITFNGEEYNVKDPIARENSLPEVTSADNGKMMTVIDGAWAPSDVEDSFLSKSNPTGTGSIAVGSSTTAAEGDYSVAFGLSTTAENNYAVAVGKGTTASGVAAHAEGDTTTASGAGAHSEGNGTTASGADAHAEGSSTQASGAHSHAEGYDTDATQTAAHAEGSGSGAIANAAHAEGNASTASGVAAHSEGNSTTASGDHAHAEGYRSEASGDGAHAEGSNTSASGDYSHASGFHTEAGYNYQTVVGKYNANSASNIFEVGNGADADNRANAFEVSTTGDVNITGSVSASNIGTAASVNLGSDQTKYLRNDGTWAVPDGHIYTNLSEFTNDVGFITKVVDDLTNYYTKSETYTQAEIDARISAIPKFAIKVVQTLPVTDISTTTVYLVPSSDPESHDIYAEYIYVDETWEKLGSQSVDLADYYTKEETDDKYAVKANPVVEGELVADEIVANGSVTADAIVSNGSVTASGDVSATGDIAATGAVRGSNIGSITPVNLGSDTGTYLRNDGTWETPPDTVVTKTSELTNDSGYITKSVSNLENYYTSTVADGKYLTKANPSGTGTLSIQNVTATGNITASGSVTASNIGDVAAENFGSDTTKFLRNDGTWAVPAGASGNYVPETRTVNNKALDADITLTGDDIAISTSDSRTIGPLVDTFSRTVINGHMLYEGGPINITADQIELSSSDVTKVSTALSNKVPTTRTVNGKALSGNITLYGTDMAISSTDSTNLGSAVSDICSTTINGYAIDIGNSINLNATNIYMSSSSSTSISSALDGKVPTTRTINGNALSSNVTLTASDVGAVPTSRTVNGRALSSNITLTASDVSAVPTTRTVNNKALSSNITLTASDVSALSSSATVNSKSFSSNAVTLYGGDIKMSSSDTTTLYSAINAKVPTSRTINSKALSSNITLTAADVSAVPTTRTVNSKALSSNITLAGTDINVGGSYGTTVYSAISSLDDSVDGLLSDVSDLTTWQAYFGNVQLKQLTTGGNTINSGAGNAKLCTSITLEHGLWIVVGIARFTSYLENGKHIAANLSSSSGSNEVDVMVGGPTNTIQVVKFIKITSTSTTIYMNAWHDNSTAMVVQSDTTENNATRIYALRLSD